MKTSPRWTLKSAADSQEQRESCATQRPPEGGDEGQRSLQTGQQGSTRHLLHMKHIQ